MPLKVVRRPRSPFFYLRGTIRGIRLEESTGVTDRGIAEEIRIRRENEILHASIHGRGAAANFAEAALSYLQTGGRCGTGGSKRFLGPVLNHFKTTPLAKIDLDGIEKGARITYPNASPTTRNRQFITPTVAILRHAAKRGLCPLPIITRPKPPAGVVRWLTLEEFEKLLGCAAAHMKPLLTFLFYVGCRVGEALWLDWRNVDLVRGHVSFIRTKNSEARGVPLHPRVVAQLANLPHRQGEVFRQPNGRPYARPRNVTDTSGGSRISTAFRSACRRAGIKNFRVHDCRHTWATWHYAANRDLGALMRLGGWKSEKMVLRYTHVNVGELAHTILALPGGVSGDSQTMKRENA
jgi:integrase